MLIVVVEVICRYFVKCCMALLLIVYNNAFSDVKNVIYACPKVGMVVYSSSQSCSELFCEFFFFCSEAGNISV